MQPDLRLVAKIYRAIRELGDAPIDEAKCERIALLIRQNPSAERLEALMEQEADLIQELPADLFVGRLCQEAERHATAERAGRETAGLI